MNPLIAEIENIVWKLSGGVGMNSLVRQKYIEKLAVLIQKLKSEVSSL